MPLNNCGTEEVVLLSSTQGMAVFKGCRFPVIQFNSKKWVNTYSLWRCQGNPIQSLKRQVTGEFRLTQQVIEAVNFARLVVFQLGDLQKGKVFRKSGNPRMKASPHLRASSSWLEWLGCSVQSENFPKPLPGEKQLNCTWNRVRSCCTLA